jgi:hypothetical protein
VKNLPLGLKILLGIFAVMEAVLFFGGIVMVMTAKDWGQIFDGYFAFLSSIALVWAISPAFRRR